MACVPQAWSSAAPLALLQACLGLEFDCDAREICFRRPRLPTFVDGVVVRSLSVGGEQVDLLLRRHASDVSVNVVRRDGRAEVTVKY